MVVLRATFIKSASFLKSKFFWHQLKRRIINLKNKIKFANLALTTIKPIKFLMLS